MNQTNYTFDDGGEDSSSPPRRARRIAFVAFAVGAGLLVAAGLVAVSPSDAVPIETPEFFDLLQSPEPAPSTPDRTEPREPELRSERPRVAAAPPEAADPEPLSSGEKVEARIVPVRSASIDDLAAVDAARPVRLVIPSIRVDAPVDAVGYDERRDEMEVPRSARRVGWYRYGPAPGEAGSAVLTAHVDWGENKGAFFALRDLEPGAEIRIDYDDGTRRTFEAVVRTSFDKDELPVEDLFARSGPPVLTLITCGGAFNPSIRSYTDNVVVQAVEVSPIDRSL